MNNNRIFGQRAESTIKILQEFAGKNLAEDSTIEKSASVEITKEDVLTAISDSKKFQTNGQSKRASVISYDDNFAKSAKKEFLKSAQNYVINKCASFGSKGVQLESGEVSLTDVAKKGLGKAVPNVKSASVEYKITNTELGRDNYAVVKVSMVDGKFVDPTEVTLNDKNAFNFTSEGWDELVKACHNSVVADDDACRHFIVMDYREYPNIGVKGSYKSLGKYSNYLQLKTLLKSANCICVDRVSTSDFGHAYEVMPDEDISLDKLANLLKENGIGELAGPANDREKRLQTGDQIIPNQSLISFVDPETNKMAYIRVHEKFKAGQRDSIGDRHMVDGKLVANPMGEIFVSGWAGYNKDVVISKNAFYSEAIYLEPGIQDFFIESIPAENPYKLAADGGSLVSEGKNTEPTKNPDGLKVMDGPGGKQKQQNSEGKSVSEGSRENDPAWGNMESANAEQGAMKLMTDNKNTEPTKNPKGLKSVGDQKQQNKSGGGTEKYEGEGDPQEFLSRGLGKGEKAKNAPEGETGQAHFTTFEKASNDCSPAADAKKATPGLDKNLDRMGKEDDELEKEASRNAKRLAAIEKFKQSQQQQSGAVAQPAAPEMTPDGAPVKQAQVAQILLQLAPTLLPMLEKLIGSNSNISNMTVSQVLSMLTGGANASQQPAKVANSLNKGVSIDDARDTSDKEKTTVISIFKNFTTLDEGTNKLNDIMGSDLKTYVRSDVAKLIRNIIRGGYRLEKESGDNLASNYDIADNSEPMKIVGIDRAKDVPENVNEKDVKKK